MIFIETKYQPMGNIPTKAFNYFEWVIGGTGTQGSFTRNGDVAENDIIAESDPFGNTGRPIWRATPDATSNADGGWNHDTTGGADKTKMYRYSVWIKRTGTSNGSTYLGCDHSMVKNITNGIVNTNPYWFTSDPPNYTDWFLYVGHIFPFDIDYTLIANDNHDDSGVWNINGTKESSPTTNDFFWIDGTVYHNHRSYLYYCTEISNRQYWCYPRIDVIDGSHPTIQDLIAGLDGRLFDFYEPLDFTTYLPMTQYSTGEKYISNMNELGFTHGMDRFWKLEFDAKDYTINKSDGTGTNITYVDNAAFFNGTSSYIDIPTLDLGTDWSVSCWYKAVDFTDYTHLFTADTQGDFAFKLANSTPSYVYWYQTTEGSKSGSINLSVDTWYHLVVTKRDTDLNLYVDGILDDNFTLSTDYNTPSTGFLIGNGNTTEDSYGYQRDTRVFDQALTLAQVNILTDMGNKTGTIMQKLTFNTLYTKGQFSEI